MGFRLKTSKKTKEIFEELGASCNLKPFVLSKLAISLSVKESSNIEDFISDSNGLELQRTTVTGQYDSIYKCLMENASQKHLSNDEYFPTYTKLHIDRGAELLLNKYKYAGGNLEKFIKSIMKEGYDSL